MRRVFGRALTGLRGEDGFGLVEAMVALGVMLATALLMAYTATAAMTPTALARERLAATGLADEVMEQVRALPFDTLKRGLDNSDLAPTTDSNIVKNCGGVSGDYCYAGERIPHACITYSATYCSGVPPGTTGSIPLVPHQRTVTLRGVPYTVSAYVTYYQNDDTINTLRVTAIVTWTPGETHTATQVQIQTIANSPPGCLSTATHPFSAPCQPYLYATARQDHGSVQVTGSVQSLSLDHASIWTTADSANLSLEQTSSVLSESRASGVDLQLTGGDLSILGKTTTSAASDNDPSQPANDYQSASTPAETSGSLSTSGGSNSVVVTTSGGDTGATTSTTSASYPAPAHACADPVGTNQTDSFPCANSNMKEGSGASPDMTMALTLNGTSANLGTATVADIAPAPSASVAFVNRDVPSGDGLVHAETTRSFGTIKLGGLPANVTAPAGWNGYLVRVTGFSDSVTAEAGIQAAAPTVSAAGTISYWNGAGYSTMTIAPGAAVSIPVAPVHIAYQQSPPTGPQVTVDIVATLTTGGTSTADPAGCGGTCTRTSANAQSASPIVGDISYAVGHSGASLCDVNLHVDLGAITAQGNYTAAPSA